VEIAKGFQLEQPRVFVSWDITHQELESLFQGLGLRRVGDGFHLSGCSSLGGLSHSLGFGFSRTGGKLSEIGLHVPGVSIEESYQQLQQHLIATFGPPTSSSPGAEMAECPHHTWLLPGVRVEHYVIEHFGPAERTYITKTQQDF
jgi:hypothetical protein